MSQNLVVPEHDRHTPRENFTVHATKLVCNEFTIANPDAKFNREQVRQVVHYLQGFRKRLKEKGRFPAYQKQLSKEA